MYRYAFWYTLESSLPLYTKMHFDSLLIKYHLSSTSDNAQPRTSNSFFQFIFQRAFELTMPRAGAKAPVKEDGTSFFADLHAKQVQAVIKDASDNALDLGADFSASAVGVQSNRRVAACRRGM